MLTGGRRGMYALGSFDHAPLKYGPLLGTRLFPVSLGRADARLIETAAHAKNAAKNHQEEMKMKHSVYRPPDAVAPTPEKDLSIMYIINNIDIVDLGAGSGL